jgi:hypothetical protein
MGRDWTGRALAGYRTCQSNAARLGESIGTALSIDTGLVGILRASNGVSNSL